MSEIQTKIVLWHRDGSGRPIFQDTSDALFYGVLISNHPDSIDELKHLRAEAYKEIEYIKKMSQPNFQRIVNLSFRAQMYREAYTEAERLKGEARE